MRRVVVTGIGCISPLGATLEDTMSAIIRGESGVRYIPEWEEYRGLKTRLGAPVQDSIEIEHPTAKACRSMGRAAFLSTAATEQALRQAELIDSEILSNGRTGIAYGSGTGSPQALTEVCRFLFEKTTKGITGTTYHRMMSHTCAANMGIYFGVKGRVLPTSSACTSGSLGIGYAYEQVAYGIQDVMIAGGAEEFAPPIAAIFDVLYACSVKNDEFDSTPRPFDAKRDGLVIAEGSATLILEEYEHALKRGAVPLAELVGFGTNSDGHHITAPLQDTIETSIRMALNQAGIKAEQIDYINAHATGTPVGDVIESRATLSVMGSSAAVSSLKGHTGHMLGASGAVEAAVTLAMMERGWFCPTRNLDEVDSECAPLNYIVGDGVELPCEYVMSNTFAFGGVNTSLIFKKIS